jgi:hypothetical protein
MARHASTYRQARRQWWKESDMNWKDANQTLKENQIGVMEGKRFGPVRSTYTPSIPKPSKYEPHIGAKQRAKGQGK